MDNSFEAYEGPPLDRVFASDFKDELLAYKAGGVGVTMARYLLLGNTLQSVTRGESKIGLEIDCEPLLNIGLVEDPQQALQVFRDALYQGIEIAQNQIYPLDETSELYIEASIDEDNPYKLRFESLAAEE